MPQATAGKSAKDSKSAKPDSRQRMPVGPGIFSGFAEAFIRLQQQAGNAGVRALLRSEPAGQRSANDFLRYVRREDIAFGQDVQQTSTERTVLSHELAQALEYLRLQESEIGDPSATPGPPEFEKRSHPSGNAMHEAFLRTWAHINSQPNRVDRSEISPAGQDRGESFLLQPKLAVGSLDDPLEREADTIAARVISAPGMGLAPSVNALGKSSGVQRKCSCGGTCSDCQAKKVSQSEEQSRTSSELIQRKCSQSEEQNKVYRKAANGVKPAAGSSADSVRNQLGSGRGLEGDVRSRMESAFGADFSGVEIHADDAGAGLSADLNARAFTLGNHIAFAAGEYQPGTRSGDALLAHELTHVVQQGHAVSTDNNAGTKQATPVSAIRGSSPGSVQRQPKQGAKVITRVEFWKPDLVVFFLSDGTTHTSSAVKGYNPAPGNYIGKVDANGQATIDIPDGQWFFKWDSRPADLVFEPGSRIEVTVFSTDISRLLKSGDRRDGARLNAAERSQIANTLQQAGYTADDEPELNSGKGRPARNAEEAIEAAEKWAAQHQAEAERSAEESNAILESYALSTVDLPEVPDVYRKYLELRELAADRSQFGIYKFLTRHGDLEIEIAKGLQEHGVAGIPDFERRIAAFEAAFRSATVSLALKVLKKADQVCSHFLRESNRLYATGGWNERAKNMIASLDRVRADVTGKIDAADELSDAAKKRIAQGFTDDMSGVSSVRRLTNPEAAAQADREVAQARVQQETAEKARKQALDVVAKTLPEFPFVAWPDFPREKLLNARDPGDVSYWINWYLIEHQHSIRESMNRLQSDSRLIYKLDVLIARAKDELVIGDESIAGLIIKNEMKEASKESALDKVKTALLFAFAIVSAFVPGGIGIAAAAAGAAIGVSQTVKDIGAYNEDTAAYQANLSSEKPSEVGVFVDVATNVLDVKGLADLVPKSGLNKAVKGLNSGERQVGQIATDAERATETAGTQEGKAVGAGASDQTADRATSNAKQGEIHGTGEPAPATSGHDVDPKNPEGSGSAGKLGSAAEATPAPKQLEDEVAQLREKIKDPEQIRDVLDERLAKDYDFQVSIEVGGESHTYYHRPEGTWCRASGKAICGYSFGQEIEDALETTKRARRPSSSGKPTEQYVQDFLGPGFKPQKRHFEGTVLRKGPAKLGMSISDFSRGGARRTIVEVKNINIAANLETGFADLREQTGKYLSNIADPAGSKFWLFLDVRGQRLPAGGFTHIVESVQAGTGHVFDNIYFITEHGVVLY